MIECFQKRDNDIADDREGDENIECTADTVALVADLDDVKYFFLHVESSLFLGQRKGMLVIPSYGGGRGMSRNAVTESVNFLKNSHI